MRRVPYLRFIVLGFLSIIFLGACSKTKQSDQSQIRLDQMIIHDWQGNMLDTQQAKGKWVLLNFWASWCHPCQKEIPELAQFKAAHEGDVYLLGVDMDPTDTLHMAEHIKRLGINYPVTTEDLSAALHIPIDAMPTTAFIDPQGHLHAVQLKLQTSANLEATIKSQ